MSRSTCRQWSGRPAGIVGLAAILSAAPVAADPLVQLVSPPAEQPVFGEVSVAAVVVSKNPVKWVDFYVDGSHVGRVEQTPYVLDFDVGQTNVQHHFRAVAQDLFGNASEARMVTPKIEVDAEVDVELQQLFVSVTDRRGRRVTTLAEDDFTVVGDRGRRETIATFGGGDLPISSVLLLDASESMQGARFEAALAGVQTFVDHTREEDETMLALFSDRLLHTTAFTADQEILSQALAGIEAAGGTAINDHLYFALNRLESRLGRRVVVLLSDGYDISSLLDMEQVLWSTRRSQAMLYWIRLEDGSGAPEPPSFNSSWRDAESNQRQFELMQKAVTDSGGRIITIQNLGQLDHAFRSVIEELREQYVIGFHPADRRYDGSWRSISVKVRGGGLDVRARSGYVDG